MKIGNASYGGGQYKKKNYFKLKDGESVYRILPPLGELAESGRWSMFYNVHHGYKNSKGERRAFQSPLVKNKKTKMIEVPDAALERIDMLKAKMEEAKAKNDLPSIEQLGRLIGNGPKIMAQFNMDNNHHMNVIDQQGNIGVLQIRHRAKIVLDAEIKRLNSEGVDPLSVENGRFFVFRRTGTGLDTSFSVSVLKKKIHIDGIGQVEQDVVHKLTDDIINRLGSEAAQLEKLFRRPTSEQVARIVKEGAKAVDEIFDTKTEAPAQVQAAEPPADDAPDADYQEPVAAALPKPAAPVVQAQVAPKAAPTTVVAPAQTQAPKAAQSPKPAPAPQQSDEDFLASLG